MKFDLTPRDLLADFVESVKVSATWGAAFFLLQLLRILWDMPEFLWNLLWNVPTGTDEHGRTFFHHTFDIMKLSFVIGFLIAFLILVCRLSYDVWFYFAYRRMRRRGRYFM